MKKRNMIGRSVLGTTLAALMAAGIGAVAAQPAAAQSVAPNPTNNVLLSKGQGKMIRLNVPMTDIFVADPGIADVQIRSADQLYVFGKGEGETTIFATNAAGKVVYAANVRVAENIDSVDDMLRKALPDSNIEATTMNGFLLLTGTVQHPADIEDANRLAEAFVGGDLKLISRLKTATPLQVMLQVKIAEVSRSLTRQIGVNITSRDASGGSTLGVVGRGGNVGSFDEDTGVFTFEPAAGSSAAGILVRNVLGVDIAALLEANENSGLVTILAEPTLTALSGETASFLAGGEFPIPMANGISGTSVEFKQYGVSLAFTPIVLEGGRISMRVRPEVSELGEGVVIDNFEVPGLTTRRTETTVELGSGQSFMIGGLLRNNATNTIEKTPFLGDIPILGSLFRSTGFRRSETELVIVVTPYLVKPVSASQIALPTDGYRVPTELQRVFLDQRTGSRSGETRPGPVMTAPQTVAPAVEGAAAAQPAARAALPAAPAPAPGFSL